MKLNFKQITSNFRVETRGNVAAMFAVSTFALIGSLALAVDLSNAFFAKQRLQDTTDAIALMAAKDKTLDTNEKMTEVAQALYDATYPNQTGQRIIIENIVRNGDAVTVVAQNNIKTYFTGIFNRSDMDVGVASTATYSDKAMDIALVLDTTYSMSENNKIGSLKSAATGLLDTFEDLNNDNLRVAVVPFSEYVNVGTARRNETWLDVPADKQVCKSKRDVLTSTNCQRIQSTCYNDGVAYDCSYNQCDKTYSEPYQQCWSESWSGCVGSRMNGFDERVGYEGRKIPGLTNVNCSTELQILNSNMQTAKATVSGLQAYSETYIPAGVLWGWRTLDETVPLSSAGATVKADREKVMIVMTDGENQRSKSDEYHDGTNINAANTKTDKLCDEAKLDGITIYTIAYDVNDATTKSMLNRCATDGSKFFDATNASELNKAFEAIGNALNQLRISS